MSHTRPAASTRSPQPRILLIMLAGAIVIAGLLPALTSGSEAGKNDGTPILRPAMKVNKSQAADKPELRPRGVDAAPAKGLVYRGLGHSDRCPGGFVLEGTRGVCSHGPDAPGGEHGPASGNVIEPDDAHDHASHDHNSGDQSGDKAKGRDKAAKIKPVAGADIADVRNVPTTSQLLEAAGELRDTAVATGSSQLPCYGDGTSGSRVQAIYAVASDQTDRYAALIETFPTYAARTNAVFANSGQQAGQVTNLRWVHTPDCRLDVLHVVLSPTGDDSFANTRSELMALGLNRSDRKYLVWVDAGVYCGIANVANDDRPGQENANNRGPTFGRVDAKCWGNVNAVEAHEIAHTLGAVQLSAPHSNGAWHCFDEYDRMCYNDGSGVAMQFFCSTSWEGLLDCRGDDYFNPTPQAGSYLAGHWNLYSSAFLARTPPDNSSPLPSPSPTPTTSSPTPAPTTSSASPSPTPTKSDEQRPDPAPTSSSPTTSAAPTSTTSGPQAKSSDFSGSLNKKQTIRTFTISVGDGEVSAHLTPKKSDPMTLSLFAPNGSLLAETSGGGSLVIPPRNVSSGAYALTVKGTSGSFTLTARYSS